jgi:hypothetical protein
MIPALSPPDAGIDDAAFARTVHTSFGAFALARSRMAFSVGSRSGTIRGRWRAGASYCVSTRRRTYRSSHIMCTRLFLGWVIDRRRRGFRGRASIGFDNRCERHGVKPDSRSDQVAAQGPGEQGRGTASSRRHSCEPPVTYRTWPVAKSAWSSVKSATARRGRKRSPRARQRSIPPGPRGPVPHAGHSWWSSRCG